MNKKPISEDYSKDRISEIMNIAKVMAIFSVIIAHSRNVNLGQISIVTERFGAIGVVLFLFIAGYYFHPKPDLNISGFLKKKVFNIFIPWVITGTLVFFVGKDYNLFRWANWIIGNGTYLYYLTMLICCYILLYYQSKNIKILTLCILLNVISLVLTSFYFFDLISNLLGFRINNYLNVLNWIGYFALGILAKDYMGKFLLILNKKIISLTFIYLLCLIIGLYIEPINGGYFSTFAIPMEIMGGILILSIATLQVFDRKLIYEVSNYVFAIYLTHFLIFPIKRLMGHSYIFEFFTPLAILTVDYIILMIGLKIFRYLGFSKLYTGSLGIRNESYNVIIR